MPYTSDLVGAYHSLKEVTKLEEFQTWLSTNEYGEIDDFISGYKILIRATYQMFQEYVHRTQSDLNIETDLEYQRAYAEIADIDAISPESEASNLIKHLEKIDAEVDTTHNAETLSDALCTLQNQVIDPFESLLSRTTMPSSTSNANQYREYVALFSLVTFANDTTRGYPEAFQIGWFKNRLSPEAFDDNFEEYKLALYWLYQKISSEEIDLGELDSTVLQAKDWSGLNGQWNSTREALLEPYESQIDKPREQLHQFDNVGTPDEISHLLSNAPHTAVGSKKALDSLFLWDVTNRASDVIYGSGAAGLITLLMGVRSIRKRMESERSIQIRRLKHQEEPGFSYSYAIELSGWSLQGTGSLHGWAVFVRLATDYSGFGGSQYELIEEYLEELVNDDTIAVQEIEVLEEELEEYLSNQGTREEYSKSRREESSYDKRRLSRIIREGEDHRTEFKEGLTETKDDIAKEIAALANHEGGVFILGIRDDGKVEGVDNVDKIDNMISNFLRETMHPPLSAEIYSENIRGKDLVIVEVPNADRPVAIDYIYYGRNGRNKRKLTYPELKKRYD